MQRIEKKSRNEIWVTFFREDVKHFRKGWPYFFMKPRKLVFKFDTKNYLLKEKNFEDWEIGDLNAVVALIEFAKRIAKTTERNDND